MGNEFQSSFNNVFGSNLTHISNATGNDLVIGFMFKTVELQKSIVNVGTVGKNPTADVKLEFDKINWNFKFKLANRHFHQYQRRTNLEYMTVIDQSGNLICENYPVEANRSFILTKHGIKPQKYGSSNFFEDTRGTTY